MAWAVLKGLNAPSLVSRVEIDAAAGKVTSSERCKIQGLKTGKDFTMFDREDEVFPMPIDQRAQAALKLAPILQDLNRYELKVDGLQEGTYSITIDGEPVGENTAVELSVGANLSGREGPLTKQAEEVLKLVIEKNDLFFKRWRNVQLYEFPAWADAPANDEMRKKELARLDNQIAELEERINAARKPKVRHFALKKRQG
jgi:hypothetical protein